MTRQERYLYHQIHPLKLATDWGSAFVSLYFFWRHDLLIGPLILFVPSAIAIAAGFLIIVLAWVWGLLRPAASA